MEKIVGEMTEEDYMKNRFEKERAYYSIDAYYYQLRWLWFSILIVLLTPLPIVILAFVDIPFWARLVITSASYLSTVLSALLSLLKYREAWITYRSTEEEMLKEYYHYKTGTDVYENIKDDKERFKLFVKRVEEIIAKGRSKWLDLIQRQSTPPERT